MARGVNKVILVGNVGKDPEIRATQGGMNVASFSLATTDRTKGQDGQWTDRTEWHNLVAFQRTAEIVRDYVKKGSQIYVEGKIQTRSWDDKESGQKKYKTEILVNDLQLLGGRGEGASSGGERSSGGYSQANSSSYAKSNTASYDQRQPAGAPDYGDTLLNSKFRCLPAGPARPPARRMRSLHGLRVSVDPGTTPSSADSRPHADPHEPSTITA